MRSMKKKRIDLQLLKEYWAMPENWGKTLKQICEELQLNYNSVAMKMKKYGTQNFYEERNKLMKENLNNIKDIAYKALLQKIQDGNVKALEMFLKMTGELTEKVEITGTVNIAVITKKKIIQKVKDANPNSNND